MQQKDEEKNSYQAEIFANRLAKKYKQLRKWARRNKISCYRIYDRDIPEVPLALDLYEFVGAPVAVPAASLTPLAAASIAKTPASPDTAAGATKNDIAANFENCLKRISEGDALVENEIRRRRYAVMFLYERKGNGESDAWLSLMAESAAAALNIEKNHVIVKTRRHEKGGGQYAGVGNDAPSVGGIVAECGEFFFVNLTDYIDSGLFFDHRPLRSQLRKISNGKSVLNLFCYTASFSVYAASGGASRIESVDLSNTYLSWAQKNMRLNDFSDRNKYFYTKSDVSQFIFQKKDEIRFGKSQAYDIIILDPPTFSNSKMSRTVLDINRDWQDLVSSTLDLLAHGGVLFFSTNSKKLKFDKSLIKNTHLQIEEITDSTIPEDFAGKKAHRVWKIVKPTKNY